MRFFLVIHGYGILLILIFLIGVFSPDVTPEDFKSPQTAKEFLRRGKLYAKREEYEKALADFNQAEQLRPPDRDSIYHSIYFNQAIALTELNRPQEAIEKYEKIKQMRQEDGLSTGSVDREIATLQEEIKQGN